MSNVLKQLFLDHGDAYQAEYGDRMPHAHKKVIYAIQHCGTGRYGNHTYECNTCGNFHSVDGSCGNRNCPTCQGGKSDEWLRKQMKKALPCTYFMITFTVPAELRTLIRSNQKEAYKALFKAASVSIKMLAKDKRFVGCDIAGFTGVLHTWTRQLEYHPHIHFIVPGGGLNPEGTEWKSSSEAFFIHGAPLGKMFRGIFMEELKKAELKPDPVVWQKDWIINVENVGNGENALNYLAQYIFRIAIAPSRIIEVTKTHVTFKYQNSDTKKWKRCTLETFEFMRRYLQHVLPSGFTKVRHYGFMAANCKFALEHIVSLITNWLKELGKRLPKKSEAKPPKSKPPLKCKRCGGLFIWQGFVPPDRGAG
jgi:hypothetical protein